MIHKIQYDRNDQLFHLFIPDNFHESGWQELRSNGSAFTSFVAARNYLETWIVAEQAEQQPADTDPHTESGREYLQTLGAQQAAHEQAIRSGDRAIWLRKRAKGHANARRVNVVVQRVYKRVARVVAEGAVIVSVPVAELRKVV